MRPSLQKLIKFIQLEAQHNYDNRSVIGGFERMVEPWLAEAQADALPAELISAVRNRIHDYASLSPKSRYETLSGLWNRLQHEADQSFPPLPELTEAAPKPVTVEAAAQPTTPAHKNLPHPAAPPAVQTENPPKPAGQPAALSAPTTVLPGVGAKYSQTLARLGLNTLGDMLYNFPRRYDDYTQLKPIQRLR